MNELVIRAVDLKKVYRLYTKPHYRFLDMLGLLSKKGAYTEHMALAGVNVEIYRGEKVAIIGRNGAGKSTLLKLISKVIEPTSGSLQVRGAARALLQIGSGFHPDFTGRENVFGYLAYLGITGKDAERRFSEIVEFAEMEEYIDQPLKTYSTGMAVRLMFSTSTAIAPDILVLDEVLSVGDAYFSQKSFEKIKELSERNGTTLLLVSHDIYSAAKLCPRVIWLDRGQILIDGDGPTVVKAYEDSIREQEEQRLRTRKQNRLQEIAASSPGENVTHIVVEFRSRNNLPQPHPVYFSSIRLERSGVVLASIPLEGRRIDEQTSHVQLEACTWGETVSWQGRTARPMVNFGGSFHKAAAVFCVRNSDALDASELELIIEYWMDGACDLLVRAFHGTNQFDLGELPSEANAWRQHTVRWSLQRSLASSPAQTFLQDISMNGVHGSGAFGITDVAVLNDHREETSFLSHGLPAEFRIHYVLRDPSFEGKAQVLVAVKRDGIHDVCRLIARDMTFHRGSGGGTIHLLIRRLGLANGRYTVTVMIAKEGYYDQDQYLFYSINPDVYACVNRITEFEVRHGGIVGSGTGVVCEGEWSLNEDEGRVLEEKLHAGNP